MTDIDFDDNSYIDKCTLSIFENNANKYDNSKTIRQNIGTTYEYFVLEHIKKDYDQVWHWLDFPEEKLYELNIIKDYNVYCKYRNDMGADLVAVKDNIYYFVQCKNYSETIMINDLAGFYFFIFENNLNGILCYNGNLSKRYEDLSCGKIKVLKIPFNTQNVYINKNNNLVQNIEPRKYQLDACDKLKNAKNGLLDMPCGTGKLVVASYLAKNYENIFIFSPLKMLAWECLQRMHIDLNRQYEPILISSDGERNFDKIKQLMKKKNLFSVTYDSVDVALKIVENLKNVFIIIDEYHNLSKNNLENKNNDMYKLLKTEHKKLYMSATPSQNIKHDSVYKYTWSEAIINNYICDFKIIIPMIEHKLDNFKKFIGEINKDIDIKMYCKAYFILKGVLFNGNKKCIVFLTTINKAEQFEKCLEVTSKLLNVELKIWQLNCNIKKTKRDELYDGFKKSNIISIILNVHILDEGVNLVECDSVYITQPNNDKDNLIQRMCRANRIKPNKKICYVYMWCRQNKVDELMKYIFDKTNGYCKEKVLKFEFFGNNKNKNKTNKLVISFDSVDENEKKIIGLHDNTNSKNENNKYEIINYLKKKLVNNKCVDDYYKFYEMCQNNKFGISVDDVVKYLELKSKKIFVEKLREKYVVNKDFIIKRIKQQSRKGIQEVFYYITFDCFEKICVFSKSEKANGIIDCILTSRNFISV